MDREEWKERKAKLDAEMMDHPFLKDFTRAQRSAAEKEETLNLLADYGRHSKKEREENKVSVPIIEGFTKDQVGDYWAKRQDFLNILLERQGIQRMIRQSIVRDWARSTRSSLDEECETVPPADPDQDEKRQGRQGWFRVLLKDERDYVPLTRKNKWNSFDGVSYMNAVQDSIRSYDADYRNEERKTKASYIHLLESCYTRQLNETQKEQRNIAESHAYTLSEETFRVLNVISDYLKEKKTGCSLENLTPEDELYEQVIQHAAKATKMKPKSIRKLMPILQKIRTESLDAPVGSEGDGTKGDLVSDPATLQDMTQDRLEKQDLAFRFLQAVSKKPMKEYNRLLMTNVVLQPIHPEAGRRVNVPGGKEYAEQLKQNSVGLYKMVFHLPYLNYIEWRESAASQQKADPARIEVLCDGYPLKDLNAKSIAEYKEVTPANVTYYSKRFAEYLEEIAEQDLDRTD